VADRPIPFSAPMVHRYLTGGTGRGPGGGVGSGRGSRAGPGPGNGSGGIGCGGIGCGGIGCGCCIRRPSLDDRLVLRSRIAIGLLFGISHGGSPFVGFGDNHSGVRVVPNEVAI
jgi:hypothetical protein